MWYLFSQKVFLVWKRKNEDHHRTVHLRICLNTTFYRKHTMLNFWTKFNKKGCFYTKTEKKNTTIEVAIFKLVYVLSFTLNIQFRIFRPNLPTKGIVGLEKNKVNIILEFSLLKLACRQSTIYRSLKISLFPWKFNLPQVKRYLISSIINSLYKVTHELRTHIRLRISRS